MYSYHGWLWTFESFDLDYVRHEIQQLNRTYPVSCGLTNGQYHISFSGNPNRDLGELSGIINSLTSKKIDLSGCVYINDANDPVKTHIFQIIKIVNDKVIYMDDKNFSTAETDLLFR